MDLPFLMKDIPISSSNYIDDKKILDFCKENQNHKKCQCIYPEENIKSLQTYLFNPYYCWYEPCKDNEIYKTSLIKETQQKCNITNCKVSLGDIKIDKNGKIEILNNCISSSIINSNLISEEILIPSLNKNYILPNFFFFSNFFLISLLLLILFY